MENIIVTSRKVLSNTISKQAGTWDIYKIDYNIEITSKGKEI